MSKKQKERERGRRLEEGGGQGLTSQAMQKNVAVQKVCQVLIAALIEIFRFSCLHLFQKSVAVSSARVPRQAVERAGHALDWRGALQSLGQ